MERAPVTEIALNPYFFCENGQELSWGECAAEIGRTLKRIGRIDEVTPKPIAKENWAICSGIILGWWLDRMHDIGRIDCGNWVGHPWRRTP
jgi:hypothetical protein